MTATSILVMAVKTNKKSNILPNENQKAETINGDSDQDKKIETTTELTTEDQKGSENNKLSESKLEEVTKHHDIGDKEITVKNPIKAKNPK